MDAKIRKIERTNAKAGKELKSLEKLDKKQDRKLEAAKDMKRKAKKC